MSEHHRTINTHRDTHALAKHISQQTGRPITTVIDAAVKALQRQLGLPDPIPRPQVEWPSEARQGVSER